MTARPYSYFLAVAALSSACGGLPAPMDNRAPFATDARVVVPPGSSTTIAPPIGDDDNDPLAIGIHSAPAHGNVVVLNGEIKGFRYTPSLNFTGNDAFTYVVDDGQIKVSARVEIVVTTTNSAPEAFDASYQILPARTFTAGTLPAHDTEDNPLTFRVVETARFGVLTINAITGSFTYRADTANWSGDRFTFIANDGQLDSNTGTINLSARANSIPVAKDDSYQAESGSAVIFPVLKNDDGVNDAPLRVTLEQNPQNGAASVNSGGAIIYTAHAGYTGTDTLRYRVTDADGDTSTANVSITVSCGRTCVHTIQVDWAAVNISNVKGYYVYHGMVPGHYTEKIFVNGLTYLYDTFVQGTHYFAISVVDSADMESEMSPESQIVVP